MTSQLELNDFGKKYLKDQMAKLTLFTGERLDSYFLDRLNIANLNISRDDNLVRLPSLVTNSDRIETIEFTKDHLKFKDKI